MCNSILLAVDDKPDNLFVLEQLIGEYIESCRILKAHSAAEGLDLAVKNDPNVALIDVQMPGTDGIEMCKRLKADERTKHVPVILMTAHRSPPALRVRGLEAGADDFISKPVDNIELIARIRVLLRIRQAEDRMRHERDLLEEMVRERTREVRESEERFRALSEVTWEGISIQANNIHLLGNRQFYAMFGRTPAEWKNRNIAPEQYTPESLEILSRQMAAGDPGPCEVTAIRADGTRFPVEIRAKNAEYQGLPVRVASVRDITERKQAGEEKRSLEFQLRQAMKMEAIGTLASGIAHDFNNILTSVIGYTELALDDAGDRGPVRQNLREVLRAGDRAKELVRQILTFSRQAEQEMKPVRIGQVIREAVRFLRASLPSTIEIRQTVQSDSRVRGDPTQLHQVVMNLCANAGHAMSEKGGVLEVGLTDTVLDRMAVSAHPDVKPGDFVRLRISDTGCGIPPLRMERIFDPFFTTKKKGEGTGMGLSVVHGIVRSYGGFIAVRSQPGEGATFEIFLPTVAGQPESPVHPEPPIPTGSERILVVDDEPGIANMVRIILESLGYDVEVRTEGPEALKAFETTPDRFDLVITDMTMPRMTGTDLARKLMAIRPDIPVILCTGYSPQVSGQGAADMGIREFISKPVSRQELAETIRRVLDHPV
ncbi:hybrid sensor histidine kinase/response regulato r [Desulfonema ishimotonii]|uniref:histidine kinase n=1 Tax=Desulfonema ishimotonii TaxID=45657 RepID=A0A401FYA2_9BACT|nr:response regulator [Desulfonema ishimotonii]GBC61935.1 hybrid sensor histidine kinase/response regulato r [Desulfonema ishimotonii]